jgi:hypothetical protein
MEAHSVAGNTDPAKLERLETLSTARNKRIGQAIIDGLLTPQDVVSLPNAIDNDYNQTGNGNYTQRAGDHKQSGNGDYNQAPRRPADRIEDQVINVIREIGEIRSR